MIYCKGNDISHMDHFKCGTFLYVEVLYLYNLYVVRKIVILQDTLLTINNSEFDVISVLLVRMFVITTHKSVT